jgi:hypothetical protein
LNFEPGTLNREGQQSDFKALAQRAFRKMKKED